MTRAAQARRGRRVGKDGERNAKAFLKSQGFHIAMSEIAGLAGDDVFARSANGKWYSVEVKNSTTMVPKHLNQARAQAAHRFDRIQAELCGSEAEMYYALGMDKYRKSDWMVLWHPRGYGVSADTWGVFYSNGGRTHFVVANSEHPLPI